MRSRAMIDIGETDLISSMYNLTARKVWHGQRKRGLETCDISFSKHFITHQIS